MNEIGKHRGGISHSIRAVTDYETVVAVVVFLDYVFEGEPSLGCYVRTVDIHRLNGLDLANRFYLGNERQQFLGR